jgi:taurine---2-oxoglutarate transaminase
LDAATQGRLKSDLISRRLLPFTANNRIHVAPPAVITTAEIERGLDLIDQALTAVRS